MKTGAVITIAVGALAAGYFLGREKDEPLHQASPTYFHNENSTATTAEDQASEHEEQLEELRGKLEIARDSAEQARDAAQNSVFEANMEYIESGRVEDMIRANDAESAKIQAQDAVDEIEEALRKSD